MVNDEFKSEVELINKLVVFFSVDTKMLPLKKPRANIQKTKQAHNLALSFDWKMK
jgi:hypothetical protein